jgi:hypothetical protein
MQAHYGRPGALIGQPGSDYQLTYFTQDAGRARDVTCLLMDSRSVSALPTSHSHANERICRGNINEGLACCTPNVPISS